MESDEGFPLGPNATTTDGQSGRMLYTDPGSDQPWVCEPGSPILFRAQLLGYTSDGYPVVSA